MDDKHKY